jgi:hypothetical protein
VVTDLIVDRSAFDRVIQSGGYVTVNTGGAPDGNCLPIPKAEQDRAAAGTGTTESHPERAALGARLRHRFRHRPELTDLSGDHGEEAARHSPTRRRASP